ncbi:zinc finger protein with KRAB and SCAN domains 8-like [Ochotona princeps]|uniref:zinc finger protein with KRAB and SCAN domains 8-like n=1 Tax=Ochotona princeps TaxID=9978 RepID=UPI002714F59E|nr:zinc finger protein with KRAB and SCAN domains 8-like [Ochotona princeps]
MWSQEGSTGPELSSPVPAQDAQPELQDGSPEEWHVRFRTFNGWEDADPVRDLRMLGELCRRWLRPEVHTKEQIMDLLVLEQFLICTAPEVQVLVKESGVTSCQDLEELLRNSWRKPTSYGEAPQPSSTAVKRDPEDPSPRPHLDEERRDRERLQPLGAPAGSGEDASEGVVACGSGADPPPIPALEAAASPRSGSHRRRRVKKRRVRPEGSGEHPQAEASRFPAAACLAGAPPHPTEPAPRLYQCRDCSKSFCYRSQLVTHQRSHTGERRFQCGDCSKSFCYRSQLVTHQRSHTGERPFQCEDCSKGFMQHSDLRVHQRIHTGEKPFVCADCGHAFSHEASLVTHRRVHTQERPYECKYCGQSFSHKGNLNVHCRIHTNTKPYCCDVCGQCFRQLGTFKRHLKIHKRTVPPKQELWLHRMMAGSQGLAPAGDVWHAPPQEPPAAMHPAPAWPLLALPGAAGHLLPGFLDEKARGTPTIPIPVDRHAPK